MPIKNRAQEAKALAAAVAWVLLMAGCGAKAPEAPAADAPAAAAEQPAATPADAGNPGATLPDLTPEGMEALLAPIALYPDAVLAHVLTAATNPQMVLDAGNWLVANPDLSGRALDQAAQPLGFSPSMRALLQFPEVVDMMCMQMEWTTQLGAAFTADQAGALDAVQRLRAQAASVGNLASSEQLAVSNETQDGREVITVAPADPKVVYVPQYDPVAVYAPPPAQLPEAASTGHSTGSLITTGLLAFGAGLLVAEIFDDDDDWYDYRPNYGYGGMYYGGRPYYPPPPGFYRPAYGGSFRPGYGYTRPPGYQHGFNNNIIINVNNPGNDYWGGFGNRPGNGGQWSQRPTSPITSVRPNRPELRDIERKARPAAAPARPAATDKTAGWQGQGSYAGARNRAKDSAAAAVPGFGGARDTAQVRPAANAEAANRAAAAAAANASRDRPKPQTMGDRGRDDRPPLARPESRLPAAEPPRRDSPVAASRPAQRPEARPAQRPETRPAQRPEARPAQRPETRPAQRPETRPAQRPEARPAQRPETRPAQRPQQMPTRQRDSASANRGGARPSAFGGNSRGGSDRAASQRGRSSLPEGARSRGAGRQPANNARQRR